MIDTTRRRVLQLVSTIGTTFSLTPLLRAAQTQGVQVEPLPNGDPPERLALRLVQAVNMAQAKAIGDEHTYLAQDALLSSADFAMLEVAAGLQSYIKPSDTATVMPPYALSITVRADGYDVLVTNVTTGAAFRSDQDGLIFVGTSVGKDGTPSSDVRSFIGNRLRRPKRQAVRSTPARVLAAIGDFFFPSLNAAACEFCCCCGFCLPPGPCNESIGGSCPIRLPRAGTENRINLGSTR